MTTPNRPPIRNHRTEPDPPVPLPFDKRIWELIHDTTREGYFTRLTRLPNLYMRLASQWETAGHVYSNFDSAVEDPEDERKKYFIGSLNKEFWLYDLADMLAANNPQPPTVPGKE